MAAILVLHNWLTIDQRIIFIGLVYTQLRNTDTKIIHFRKNRDTLEHFQTRTFTPSKYKSRPLLSPRVYL